MPVRSPAAIGQAVQAAVLVALKDLVASLARDIELAADRGHLLPVEQAGDETETLIHLGTLLPRHFVLPAKCRSVTYVSGIKCYPSIRKGTLSSPFPAAEKIRESESTRLALARFDDAADPDVKYARDLHRETVQGRAPAGLNELRSAIAWAEAQVTGVNSAFEVAHKLLYEPSLH